MRPLKEFSANLGLIITIFAVSAPLGALAADPDDCDFIRTSLADPKVREVVIPAGDYTCKSPIVINRSGVSLVGSGKVILRLADHANCPLLIMGNIETPPRPVENLKVANLILEGNREMQDMECWGGPCDSGGLTVIRNNGITIRGVHKASVKDVTISRMRSGGMVTEKVCTKLHVENMVSRDNHFDGFAGYETTESVFKNLVLSENLGAGISLDIHFHGNTFMNSTLAQNKDVGIFMRDSNGNMFSGLTIQDTGNHGVFVSQVDDQLATAPRNNIFVNLTVDGAKGNGFHLNSSASTGNQLINPKFSRITDQNIYEAVYGVLVAPRPLTDCQRLLMDPRQDESMNSHFRGSTRAYQEKYRLENPGK